MKGRIGCGGVQSTRPIEDLRIFQPLLSGCLDTPLRSLSHIDREKAVRALPKKRRTWLKVW